MIRTGASLVAGGTAGLGAVVVLVLLTAVGVVQPLSLHYFPSPALQSGSARWSAPVDPTVRLVQVLRVIDGDTFEARVLLPPRRSVVTRVRLRDVDAAELKARCAREFYQALEARDALVHLLAEGEVHVFNVSPDKYPGRTPTYPPAALRMSRPRCCTPDLRGPMTALIASAGAIAMGESATAVR